MQKTSRESEAKIETKRKAKIWRRKSGAPATTRKIPKRAGRSGPRDDCSGTQPSRRKPEWLCLRRTQFPQPMKLQPQSRPRRDSCSSCCCAGCASATRPQAGFARTIPANALHQPREFLDVGPFGAALSHDGKENFFEGGGSSFGAGDAGAQLLKGTLRDKFSFVDDCNVATEAFHNFQDVRRQKNGCAAFGHSCEKGFQRAGCQRVHPFKRLIQKEDSRAMNHGCGEREFFLHAVGIVRNHRFGTVRELHELEQLFAALLRGGFVQTVHS